MAIYSASVVASAIKVGFLQAKDIAPPLSRKTNPPIDFRSCPAPQSASE